MLQAHWVSSRLAVRNGGRFGVPNVTWAESTGRRVIGTLAGHPAPVDPAQLLYPPTSLTTETQC
jgi:hypothetical protein